MLDRYSLPQPLEAAPNDAGNARFVDLYGDPNKFYWEKAPRDWRAMLAIEYGDHYRGNAVRVNEDDTRTAIRMYRFSFEESEEPNYARQMINVAIQAGYQFATRPIRINNDATHRIYFEDENHPAYELWLLFEERQGIDMLKPTSEQPNDFPEPQLFGTLPDPFVTQWGAIEGIDWRYPSGAVYNLLNLPVYAAYADSLRIPTAPANEAEPNTQT